jgi:hypothetical protein
MKATKQARAAAAECFVCGEPIRDVPVERRLAASRAMNVRVSVGPGLDRHSYCAPGTDRWAEHLGTGARDRFWAHVWGFVRRGGRWVREGA